MKKKGRDLHGDVIGRAMFSKDGSKIGVITCGTSYPLPRNYFSDAKRLYVIWEDGRVTKPYSDNCKFDPKSRNWKIVW